MRTVWIALRAVNYTDRAVKAAMLNFEELTRKQKQWIREQQEEMMIARMNMQTGMMLVAMSGMLAQNLFNLAAQTQAGAVYMAEWQRTLEEAKTALADTVFTALKPFLEVLLWVFRAIREDPALRWLITAMMMLSIAIMGVYGAYLLYTGMLKYYEIIQKVINQLIAWGIIKHNSETAAILTKASAYKTLAKSAGVAIGTFFLMYEIMSRLPPIIGVVTTAVLALAAALYFLHGAKYGPILGVALAGAAVGSMVGTLKSLGAFQRGTLFVPETGLALVHKGEVIYNPNLGLPTSIEKEIERTETVKRAEYHIPIVIEHVHTKADLDDLDEKLRESLRKHLLHSR